MASPVKLIPVEQLAADLESILEQVVHDRVAVVVETAKGERAVIKPLRRRKRKGRDTKADDNAFLTSAGSWTNIVDVEAFKQMNAESRRLSSRPPVDL